jgi:DtxR family transcriptional regulator, Mn-dependent transcriptional regulator
MTNLGSAKETPITHHPAGVKHPSMAVEDYLRAIYKLADSATVDWVQTNQLAAALKVRPASVTGMIQKMAAADPPLVDYYKNRGVRLTAAGHRAALSVVRRHRLLELFLQKMLGYSWDEVHEEADRLEHVISDEFIERLAETLNHPATDPHGHLIPSADLALAVTDTIPLSDLEENRRAVVQHVRDEHPHLLRFLADRGIFPGVVITRSPGDEDSELMHLILDCGSPAIEMEHAAAGHIFVSYE